MLWLQNVANKFCSHVSCQVSLLLTTWFGLFEAKISEISAFYFHKLFFLIITKTIAYLVASEK